MAIEAAMAPPNAVTAATRLETKPNSLRVVVGGAFDDLKEIRNASISKADRSVRLADIALLPGIVNCPSFNGSKQKNNSCSPPEIGQTPAMTGGTWAFFGRQILGLDQLIRWG